MFVLRPMTEAEFVDYYREHQVGYLAERVRAGESEELAGARMAEQHAQYFPGGRPAPRHELFVLQDDDARVGILWVGPYPAREDDPSVAWVFDIEVDETVRGHGYGAQALAALETHLLEQGVRELGLHVFGDNAVARRLYLRTGFDEKHVTMTKQLGVGTA